jgi:hypothetical protein
MKKYKLSEFMDTALFHKEINKLKTYIQQRNEEISKDELDEEIEYLKKECSLIVSKAMTNN